MLKYFTWAAANGGSFQTEWMQIPPGFQNWQLVAQVHGRISTTAGTVQLQTSWDTSAVTSLGSTANLATANTPQEQDISSGVGPLVRLTFAATADTVVTISVWLTPKSE